MGFLQQGYPECIRGLAAGEAQFPANAGQPVVHGDVGPQAVLPEAEQEGAPVPAVTPLGLVWGQDLDQGQKHP